MSLKASNEKRIYPRYNFKNVDNIVFKLDYGKAELLNLDPVNLSVGGIGGYVYNGDEKILLDVGQEVTIYFYGIGKDNNKQKIDAKICWKYYDSKEGKFFIGKQFSVITLDAWQKLLNLTNQTN